MKCSQLQEYFDIRAGRRLRKPFQESEYYCRGTSPVKPIVVTDSSQVHSTPCQMVDRKLAVPLSPPISPPMSAAGFKSDDYNLQPSADSTYISADVPDRRLETAPSVDAVGIVNSVSAGNNQTTRPTLRSYKSFPYSLGPSSRVQDATHQDRPETNVLGDFAERVLSAGPQPTASANLHQPTYGGSAPASPVGQFSEGSLKVEEHDVQMEDEDVEFGNAEDDEDATEKRTMTAAELRAHKRKMKRFRSVVVPVKMW